MGLDGECILNESSELSKRGDFEPRLELVLFIESRRGGYGKDGWLFPDANGDKRPVVFFREMVGEGGFEDRRGEVGEATEEAGSSESVCCGEVFVSCWGSNGVVLVCTQKLFSLRDWV